MENSLNAVEITAEQLKNFKDDAQAYITKARWHSSHQTSQLGSYAGVGTTTLSDEVQLIALIKSIDSDDDLMSVVGVTVVHNIRTALQVAFCIADDYRKRVGVDSFETATQDIPQDQLREFNEKMVTASAIAQFVWARHVLWSMHSQLKDNAFVGSLDVVRPELHLAAPKSGIMALIYQLGNSLKMLLNNSDDRLVAIVYRYAQLVEQEILNRTTAFRHVEVFADITYRLENSDFSILGFAQIDFARTSSIEFNRLDFGKIVGNRDAKHFMRMDAKRRACYDIKEGKNPFLELGGITPVFMGYGIPGTGKSMLISAYATLLYDICEAIGTPFFFNPLPDNIVDSFQGKSAEKMVNWMQPLQDPSRITFAPIDDGEAILENRTRQGVSEGVKGVIAVFLRYTEGAYAIVRGNSAIGVFTNIPDIIDPAVMSRIQAKFSIMGARTLEDFLDQDYLWWHKLEEFEPGFVQMAMPGTYKWLQSQKELTALSEISEDLRVPRNERVRAIFDETLKSHNINEHSFFGHLFLNICKRYPLFSSRDLRNIQTAVNLRIMDFDLPDDWFKNAASFSEKPYAEKMQMILELRRANMKGLDFATIRLEETNRYLDNMAIVADGALDREVEEGVHRMMVNAEVIKRFELSKKA